MDEIEAFRSAGSHYLKGSPKYIQHQALLAILIAKTQAAPIQASAPAPIPAKSESKNEAKAPASAHSSLAALLKLQREGAKNMLLVGPAGCGKTTLAHGLADALKLPFAFLSLSAGITESHIFGRMLPTDNGAWKYHPSQFVTIYENGGIFLLDEMDAADANVMVSINAALANGIMSNPNGQVHRRHSSTLILAAANTFGTGASAQYVGRNQLDAATLDRFVLATLCVDYDAALEKRLVSETCSQSQAKDLLAFCAKTRATIKASNMRRIISTRFLIAASNALANGATMLEIIDRLTSSWSADERAKVTA